MRIVVLDGKTLNPGDNPWSPVEQLGELTVHNGTLPDEVVQRGSGADVLVINKIVLGPAEFSQLPGLKLVAVTATGCDCVDLRAAREHGVGVANVPEYGTNSVAQFVMAMLLHWTSHVAAHADAVRHGQWREANAFSFWNMPLHDLTGKSLGIVGWGRIGRRVGHLARAFGMRLLIHSRRPPEDLPDGARAVSLAELFQTSDAVSLHCPLTEATRRLVGMDLFSRMKSSAILINTARGAIIDEDALVQALRDGRPRYAALDVVGREPIEDEHPLLRLENCIVTPHMAWATVEARQRLMSETAENIRRNMAGQPRNLVPPR